MRRLYCLDILKAIAIIVVVFFHMGYLSYGYLGVDLFLVINGYLITKSLSRKILESRPCEKYEKSANIYINFLLDKIYRLLPVLLCASLFCILWGYYVMLPDDYENLTQSIIASSFFSNNILQAITTKDYWDVVNDYKPLMHTWYVGVLMQFYLVYPILFYVARRSSSNSKGMFVLLLSVISFISLLVYLGTKDVSDRFYYLPSRFFEFGVGGLVAICYDSTTQKKIFSSYLSILLIAVIVCFFVVNSDFIPSNLRLIVVVALSVGLLLLQDNLELLFAKRGIITSVFSKVGCMSYSIFVWHQVFLAFYRYSFTTKFSGLSLSLYFLLTIIVSSISYHFIEEVINSRVKSGNKKALSFVLFFSFFAINGASYFIYKMGGVTRDVPELDIYAGKSHSGQHAEYCDRANRYNKDFTSEKKHWLVIGNSFARDFVNIILESNVKDSVEVSYSNVEYSLSDACDSRYKNADKVFISTLGITPEFVTSITLKCVTNGLIRNNILIVGEKNFGENNGQIYWRRNTHNYYDMTTVMIDGFNERNIEFKRKYDERFIDLIYYVKADGNRVRVFTDNGKFISSDCRHLTKAGAIFYAHQIPLAKYLK